MKYPTTLMAALGLFLAAAPAAFAAPTVVNGVATYSASEKIGVKAVDPAWTKIVIKANVTLTGRFEAKGRQTDLTIEGESSSTSVIKGLPRSEDAVSESKAGINKDGNGKLTVKKLKIQDQPGRGIMGWGGQLTVNNCTIVQTPNDPLTDGIHASQTGDINFSSINVYDDGTYATMCDWINGNTFNHRKNGAPIQINWGVRTGNGAEKTVTDNTFKAASSGYQCGTIDWKKTAVDNDSIKLKMSGTTRTLNGGVQPPKFSFGRKSNDRVTVNAKFFVNGWSWTASEINEFGDSTGSVSSY